MDRNYQLVQKGIMTLVWLCVVHRAIQCTMTHSVTSSRLADWTCFQAEKKRVKRRREDGHLCFEMNVKLLFQLLDPSPIFSLQPVNWILIEKILKICWSIKLSEGLRVLLRMSNMRMKQMCGLTPYFQSNHCSVLEVECTVI